MIITYHGENYFKIQSGNFTALIDPLNLRSAKGADVILLTAKPSQLSAEAEENVWIDHQGEYEVKEFRIKGFSAESAEKFEKTVYLVEFDEMKIAVFGKITKEPDEKTMKNLKKPDILILPAGGRPNLSEAAAAKIVKSLEPAIVIPASYKDIKPFLKEFKKPFFEIQEKLVVKKKDVKGNETKIVCLKY